MTGRNTATINYAAGSLTGNTFNTYLCGSAMLTTMNFFLGLYQTGTIEGAIHVAWNYFVSKLTPFPINEFLTAGGFEEVAINVAVAIAIGLAVSSFNYWQNPGHGAGY